MLQYLSPRRVFSGLALLSLVSMLFAYFYLQQHLGLPPCPLCMTQRAGVVSVGLFALVAALHNPGIGGRRIYALLCLICAGFGAAVAGRHVWLQHLPADQVPACGPSLEYMLETLPFSETIRLVMMGDGNCADTVWSFMGMSIPEQTLLLFAVMLLLCVWQLLRHR
ncbi:MAG: disulfide bond formation protein B [Parahaliea sp.]